MLGQATGAGDRPAVQLTGSHRTFVRGIQNETSNAACGLSDPHGSLGCMTGIHQTCGIINLLSDSHALKESLA